MDSPSRTISTPAGMLITAARCGFPSTTSLATPSDSPSECIEAGAGAFSTTVTGGGTNAGGF